MKTLRRMLYREIVGSVIFVALAFLSLFFFIDFVEEVGGRSQGSMTLAAKAVLLLIPGHLYELMPICVLIGAIYALARMAQSSEFTILRTGGLGPGRALGLLSVLGMGFAGGTLLIGDFVAPHSQRAAVMLKAERRGEVPLERTGAWLKERRAAPDGEHAVSINVGGASPTGELKAIRIFEFDAQHRLATRLEAARATVGKLGEWTLRDVEQVRWPQGPLGPVKIDHLQEMQWSTSLTPAMVSAAVLPLETMSTWDLWQYSRHLSLQEQAAQRHEFQFWKRALYPLACVVMLALALPFAYLHARSGGVSLRVFGGILLGISFVLLNNLAGHIGLLRDWTPWMAASIPSLIYLGMSLGAFFWLVRYR